jgi:site-specific DNA-cytosine methylase
MTTFGSLFSGIGGIDLGLERAGMTVVWQSEIDPYACRVLAKHWPDVPNLGDITAIDWSSVERPDVICGGYPCQPFSLAGVRRGEDDPRHLWPHFRDAIRHLRPRFALLENVPGHLSLGFGRVLGDLAELGYDCEWDCIPAAAVGAPHQRDRVFIVAHSARGRESSEPIFPHGGALVGPWSGAGRRAVLGHPAPRVRELGGAEPVSSTATSDALIDAVRQQPVALTESDGEAVARHDGADRDVADADRSRRPHLQGCRPAPGRPGRRAVDGAGWWDVEPDIRGVPDGLPPGLDGGLNASTGMGPYGDSSDVDAVLVRVLRDHRPAAPAPHGRGPDEQLAHELADALRVMPHPMALGTRQDTVAQAFAHLHRLRQACEAVGAMRDASLPTAEAWQSLHGEAQAWAVVGARRGLWHAEWADTPRVATGVPKRVDRLRTLGNAVVPQVAEWIGRRIMEAAA